MLYSLVRPLLFSLEAETAHHFTLEALSKLNGLGLVPAAAAATTACERMVMGVRFPNPVGLAAGLDKNGSTSTRSRRLVSVSSRSGR